MCYKSAHIKNECTDGIMNENPSLYVQVVINDNERLPRNSPVLETVANDMCVLKDQNQETEKQDEEEDTDDTVDEESPSEKSVKVKSKNNIKRKMVRFDSNKYSEMIRKYFRLACESCSLPFDTFDNAKEHHKKVHKRSGHLQCCDKKFSLTKSFRVLEHCKWHENPLAFMYVLLFKGNNSVIIINIYFRCVICKKSYYNAEGLRDHMSFIHSSDEERHFKCDLCPKMFMRRHLLNTHKKMRHITIDDKKFKCPKCGQR